MRDDHIIALIRRPLAVDQRIVQPLLPNLTSDEDQSAIFVSALVDFALGNANHEMVSKRRHQSARANLASDTSSNNLIRNGPHNQSMKIQSNFNQSIINKSIKDQSINRSDSKNQSINRFDSSNRRRQWEIIEPSTFAKDTINPIRRLVDVMNVEPNPDKPLLKLHIGDPSITGVLPTHPNVSKSVADALQSGRYNGYGPAIGFAEVRRQLADFLNVSDKNERPIQADDIILTSGCSHALQMAIEALAGPGQNILVPRPGFPLYTTLMQPHGVESRFYNLLIDRDWEADLEQMESLIDAQTAAIVVNNPNNPTGAVYSKEHLENILKLAEKHRIPIIADEIYGDMVYGGGEFYPMYTLKPRVPVLTCDGISKRYLVPGWRLGWLIFHDVDNSLTGVRKATQQLAQKIVGPCSLMQGALPSILHRTPDDFFDYNRHVLSKNVDIVCSHLGDVPGLVPIRARGAMYIMIGIDTKSYPDFDQKSISDPISAFVSRLIVEESLYCLPGSAFNYPNAIRLVTTHKFENTIEACRRLKNFCIRHYRSQDKTDAQQ